MRTLLLTTLAAAAFAAVAVLGAPSTTAAPVAGAVISETADAVSLKTDVQRHWRHHGWRHRDWGYRHWRHHRHIYPSCWWHHGRRVCAY